MVSVSLTVDKAFFEKNQKKWLEQGKTDGFGEPTYSINVSDLGYDSDEFNSGQLTITGISNDEATFGVTLFHEIDLDLATQIVEYYVKKINKVKAIMEASKSD